MRLEVEAVGRELQNIVAQVEEREEELVLRPMEALSSVEATAWSLSGNQLFI